MLTSLLLLVAGFLILAGGAEFMVRGSSQLALKLGISPLVVGLTVVAFGTSAPELAVSVESTIDGFSGIALGNVVGSNIANIGLILGITAIINPIEIKVDLVRLQIPIAIGSAFLLGLLLLDGELAVFDGLLLLLGLSVYLFLSVRTARASGEIEVLISQPSEKAGTNSALLVLFIIIGLALLVAGSQLFVTNAVDIARVVGVSEAIIGLTLVAIGTSIPELATSVAAAMRRESDIAIGNVVGSNCFNILCVLGISALAGTVSASQFSIVDFIVMLGFSLVLLPFARSGLSLTRFEGILLLASYCAYIGWISWQSI